MAILLAALTVALAGPVSAECPSSWAFAAVRPGAVVPEAFVSGTAVSIAGFASLVTATLCSDDGAGISVIDIKFAGDSAEFRADLAALHARWPDAHKLPLGVADSVSLEGVTGYNDEVVYDHAWHALLHWAETDKGQITSLRAGVRKGSPVFVHESVGNAGMLEFRINRELFEATRSSYVCKQGTLKDR